MNLRAKLPYVGEPQDVCSCISESWETIASLQGPSWVVNEVVGKQVVSPWQLCSLRMCFFAWLRTGIWSGHLVSITLLRILGCTSPPRAACSLRIPGCVSRLCYISVSHTGLVQFIQKQSCPSENVISLCRSPEAGKALQMASKHFLPLCDHV